MTHWILIEGDNGTGKDTLAESLCRERFHLVNRNPDHQVFQANARRFAGEDRVKAFMELNRQSSGLISREQAPSIMIRYWPSTLAAAQADMLLKPEEIVQFLTFCQNHLPVPDLVLHLTCDLDDRRKRVSTRGAVPGAIDDVSAQRSQRHAIALNSFRPAFPSWKTLNTTGLNKKEVFNQALKILRERGF